LVPSAALRLAALAVFVEEDVERLADRLRLSNVEQAVLAIGALGVDAALPTEKAAKALLYRLGPDAYRSRLLLAWADADAPPEDGEWRKALALPQRWQAPVFPIGGNDVMALGELKGPDIGELLKRLEQDWIESGFALDRDQLLAKGKAFIAARA
jgi:poly(A) polymerase